MFIHTIKPGMFPELSVTYSNEHLNTDTFKFFYSTVKEAENALLGLKEAYLYKHFEAFLKSLEQGINSNYYYDTKKKQHARSVLYALRKEYPYLKYNEVIGKLYENIEVLSDTLPSERNMFYTIVEKRIREITGFVRKENEQLTKPITKKNKPRTLKFEF